MGSLVAIGNFDGVHRGHQAVLAFAARAAAERGLRAKLLTFFPHPATVLGRTPPPLLTTQARKRELCARHAPTVEFVERVFDLDFASQSPADFAESLVRNDQTKMVVVGKNFRFGKARAGDFAELERLGHALGFEAASEELKGDVSGAWSSTRIRKAIADGALDDATEMLGRCHSVSGRVVRGKELGRTIGFPTANLSDVRELLPPSGIYAVLVDRISPDGRVEALAKGAMSLGTNPTTDATDDMKLEVHLLDTSADLYGSELRVHLVRRLRPEARFDGLDALVKQIALDVEQTRALLGSRAPDPVHGTYG
jgi:riboflavin kinase/FMN adenylyltransferase